MAATVRRALLRLDSDLDPDPQLYLESARYAMTLLDLDLADRFATAAANAGAPGAAGVRAMNLLLLGRGEQAEARCVTSPAAPTAITGRRCGRPT